MDKVQSNEMAYYFLQNWIIFFQFSFTWLSDLYMNAFSVDTQWLKNENEIIF